MGGLGEWYNMYVDSDPAANSAVLAKFLQGRLDPSWFVDESVAVGSRDDFEYLLRLWKDCDEDPYSGCFRPRSGGVGGAHQKVNECRVWYCARKELEEKAPGLLASALEQPGRCLVCVAVENGHGESFQQHCGRVPMKNRCYMHICPVHFTGAAHDKIARHHPVLCEVAGLHEVSHTCVRPSHLCVGCKSCNQGDEAFRTALSTERQLMQRAGRTTMRMTLTTHCRSDQQGGSSVHAVPASSLTLSLRCTRGSLPRRGRRPAAPH